MPTRFIYLSLPCTTALRGTGERGLELMSRQIEVRLFECSQLEEDTFISSYWVSQSLYGIGGVAGGPPSNEATPSSLPHSSSQRLPHQKKREPQPVENVCLLQPSVRPTLGQMPERDPLRYSFLLYIDPGCPPPPYLTFRVHMTRQITKKSELKTLIAKDIFCNYSHWQKSELSSLCHLLPQCDFFIHHYGPKYAFLWYLLW